MYLWIRFVYTVPVHRGNRYSEKLMNHTENEEDSKGYDKVYVATDYVGLYEKFGYEYLENCIGYRATTECYLKHYRKRGEDYEYKNRKIIYHRVYT